MAGGMIIGYDENNQPITYSPGTQAIYTPPTTTTPSWTVTPPPQWSGGGGAGGGGGSSGFGAGPITAPAAPPAPPPTPTPAPTYHHYGRTEGDIGLPTYQFNFNAPSGTPLGTGITPPQWEANWKPSTGSFTDSIKYTMDVYHVNATQAKNFIDAQKAYQKKFGFYPQGQELEDIKGTYLGSGQTVPTGPAPRRGGGGGYSYGGGGGGGGAPAVPPPIGPPKGNIGPPTITPFGANRDHVVLPENTLATLPDNIRPIFDQLMRRLGYQGMGNYGQFGEREYTVGSNGLQPWTDSLILGLAGGDVVTQAWLRWIASALGLSGAQAGWPGAGTITAARPGVPEVTQPNPQPGTITAPTG